jgi:hypothetical protein
MLVKDKPGGGVTVEYCRHVVTPGHQQYQHHHLGPGSRAYQCTDGPQHISHRIDESCRVIFPVLFAIFNVLYWSHYLVN